jgi:uncharacterized SAM-binding protein YcdF (DUF218 family)
MFVRIVSPFFFPLPVVCEILALGLALLWFTRKQKTGKVLVTLAAALLLLVGNGRISGVLLKSLEQRYRPVAPSSLPAGPQGSAGVWSVVVLGGGFSSDPLIDTASRLSQETIARLVEGISLCRELSPCRLILSGGPPGQAEAMRSVAMALGVRQAEIVLESNSRNTEQEGRFIAPTVGKAPFLLVTSASHMPRAMALLMKQGMNPIAAPTDYLAKQAGKPNLGDVFPGYYGLYEASRAVYEYLGLTWERLRGEI